MAGCSRPAAATAPCGCGDTSHSGPRSVGCAPISTSARRPSCGDRSSRRSDIDNRVSHRPRNGSHGPSGLCPRASVWRELGGRGMPQLTARTGRMYVDVLSHRPSRRRQFVRTVWRDRLRPAARAARPVVLAVGAVIVVVFGMIGFAQTDPHETVLDSGYRALELFTFGGNTSAHPNPWLEIARTLAPIVVGVAALRAIALLYRDQIQLLRCRSMRNHMVVAGLGTAGFTMARALDRDDWRVVVVEQDAGNAAVKGCRERGIGVVIGDATDPRILRKAGLGRAILFVAMCGDDGTNADAAAGARTVTAERTRGILTTLVELGDFGLWGVMKAQAFLTRDGTPFRLHFFNAFALAAEMLLHQFPAFDPASPGSPHVLVVGTDGVGTSLVMEILKAWLNAHRSADDRLRVTLAGPSAGDERDRLIAAHPEI